MMNALRRLKSWDGLAILALTLWPFVYFWPVTLVQKAFDGMDVSNFHLPIRYELERALSEGRLPLWSPNIGAGFPLIAEGHIAVFYPFILLFHLLLPLVPALSYSILFHFAWASVGMYLLARVIGLRPAGACLSGLVFGLNGFFLAHLPHLNLSAAAAWLPWLILLQIKFWKAEADHKRARGGWFFLISLAIALQLLTGYAQIVVLSMIVFGLSGLLAPFLWQPQMVRDPQPPIDVAVLTPMLRSAAVTFAQIAAGAGIAAIQLLPTLEMTEQSVREQIGDPGFDTSYSLDPRALSQLVAPFGWLGAPSITNQEYWAYIGVVPILLAFAVLLVRRDALTWFLALVALCAAAFSLGAANPAYSLILHLPLYDRFRVPARLLFLFVFAGALLAGIGLNEWSERLGESRVTARTAGPLVAMVGIASIALEEWRPLAFWMKAWEYLPWLIALLGVGLLWFARRHVIGRIAFQSAVLGLAVADLALFAYPFLDTVDSTAPPSTLTEPPRAISVTDARSTSYRLYTNIYNETLRPNHTLLYDRQSAQTYSPLALDRNEDYVSQLTAPMLDLMNIRYYFLPSGPLPAGLEEPTDSVVLNVFDHPEEIPPTRVAQVEIVSYADQASKLPDGFLAGELELSTADGAGRTLPIRIGIETADWTEGALDPSQVDHHRPEAAIPFPAYLLSLGESFDGLKYVARYNLASPLDITAVEARSYLPDEGLTIEGVTLVDPNGRRISLASLAHRNNLSVAFKSHAVTVLENQDVYPRAFIVHQAERVADDQVLARLQDPGFEPDRAVLLSEGQSLPADEEGGKDAVTITQYEPERVVLSAQNLKTGYLVLADSWYPGWEAHVDGVSVPIYRADYIFRAVLLPPGNHQVVFEFHPAIMVWGAGISALSLLGAAIPLWLGL